MASALVGQTLNGSSDHTGTTLVSSSELLVTLDAHSDVVSWINNILDVSEEPSDAERSSALTELDRRVSHLVGTLEIASEDTSAQRFIPARGPTPCGNQIQLVARGGHRRCAVKAALFGHDKAQLGGYSRGLAGSGELEYSGKRCDVAVGREELREGSRTIVRGLQEHGCV
ncbi:hypothetical protein C8Q80DRAFT_781787 [Daedaleopsis nitida]|nr:hypothetical protein C8Q80DRAFT_781787 [Daedaleopsis nitida]